MQQREGQRRGVEGLPRKVQHHRAVLADRIEHHRPRRLGDRFAHDVDALGLQPVEMGQRAHWPPPSSPPRRQRSSAPADPGRFSLPQAGLRQVLRTGHKGRNAFEEETYVRSIDGRLDRWPRSRPPRSAQEAARPPTRAKPVTETRDQRQARHRLCRPRRRQGRQGRPRPRSKRGWSSGARGRAGGAQEGARRRLRQARHQRRRLDQPGRVRRQGAKLPTAQGRPTPSRSSAGSTPTRTARSARTSSAPRRWPISTGWTPTRTAR